MAHQSTHYAFTNGVSQRRSRLYTQSLSESTATPDGRNLRTISDHGERDDSEIMEVLLSREDLRSVSPGSTATSADGDRPRPSSAPTLANVNYPELEQEANDLTLTRRLSTAASVATPTPGKATAGVSDAMSILEISARNASNTSQNSINTNPVSPMASRAPSAVSWRRAVYSMFGKEPQSASSWGGVSRGGSLSRRNSDNSVASEAEGRRTPINVGKQKVPKITSTEGVDYISSPIPDRATRKGKVFVVLVLALGKKVHSKPMNAILQRLVDFPELDVCVLEEDALLTTSPDKWPRSDCLIAFGTGKYPISKVQEYANRVGPVLLNDLDMQHLLLDRRDIYRKLTSAKLPVPPHIVVVDENPQPGEYTWDQIEERDDALGLVDGEILLQRPFVEKPIDSGDHNITIYFASTDGGGCQQLFRKTKADRCSEYVSGYVPVTGRGCRIFEKFISTGGTDIKVYTVTGGYAHAEGRKAPVVDGKVLRDAEGKEMRCPILLNSYEKWIAQQIVQVFKQNVCGFDILRHHKQSFVCDVNGWSFVKQSRSYFDDCSKILRGLINRYCKSRKTQISMLASAISPMEVAEIVRVGTANVEVSEVSRRNSHSKPKSDRPELLCVIAILRHGERTPKQKMKVKTSLRPWLELYNKYRGTAMKEIKLKSRLELLAVLNTAEDILKAISSKDEKHLNGLFVDSKLPKNATKLLAKSEQTSRKIKLVLRRYPLQGINRKVQITPLDYVLDPSVPGGKRVTKVQVNLKWGGEVTEQGVRMAKHEGEQFRSQLYVQNDTGGLLRLHNTFRHDLKIYSSDEGRVQTTAAAFAKGLLGLEGQLPPILVSLVRKDKSANIILDDTSSAKHKLEEVKRELHRLISRDTVWPTAEMMNELNLSSTHSVKEALSCMTTPWDHMKKLRDAMDKLLLDIAKMFTGTTKLSFYEKDALEEIQHRWEKAADDFCDKGNGTFDVSKIPDIFDSVRYDSRHNRIPDLLPDLQEIHEIVKPLADVIVPQEYGMNSLEKHQIASKISSGLRQKILHDLRSASNKSTVSPLEGGESQSQRYNPKGAAFVGVKSQERNVRSRIYFTSESHIYAMTNMLRSGYYETMVKSVDCVAETDMVTEVKSTPASSPDPSQQNRLEAVTQSKVTAANTWDLAVKKMEEINELGYLSQVILRLYERPNVSKDSPHRFTVEWLISTGQKCQEPLDDGAAHVEPIFQCHSGMPLEIVEEFLSMSAPASTSDEEDD